MNISPNDNKNYRSLTLENGLRVVFVESKSSHKSACSLVVNTGHFDDPHDRPGFAHFVEHLLFNGNKKYPQANAINNFTSQRGGQCNAWTGTEHSCYYFDIQPEWFASGLDYFANLFVDPLFTAEALAKEQDAIHAEYNLKLKDDSRRIQQVHKETCNPEHPFHKFSVGNRHTLSDLPQRPVIDELNEFWQDSYQANFMTLCLVSPHSLAEQESLVTELFSVIPSKNTTPASRSISAPLYRPEDKGVFIGINPVKELHKLNLTFVMPDMNELYKSKMLSFLAHIMGHEGSGSLYESLKALGFINALSAGNGISGSNFKDFNISLELTEKGESEIESLLKQVFAYLNYLRNQQPESYLYDEQKTLTTISFEFQEEIKPVKLANQISLNMQHYPEADYISGDYRMDGLSLATWNNLFDYFTADNMRVTLVSQSVQANREASWYHTPYSVTPLTQEFINELNQQYSQDFKLPCQNPYLGNDIQLETADFMSTVPISLAQEKGWQCWFKQDISFRVPKGNIYLGMDLPNGIKNKHCQALMRLFCDLFMDAVSEQHYQAEMAGLHYNVYAHNSGITLYTSGLSNNQHGLLLTLIDNMFNVKFNKLRFNEVRRQLIKHWRNSESNKPISQLFSLLNAELIPSVATSFELAEQLEQSSYEEFIGFHAVLFENLYAEILLYGNWNSSQALSINQEIKHKFDHCNPVQEIERQLTKLPPQQTLRVEKTFSHPDCAAVVYLQGIVQEIGDSDDLIEKALFILCSQILAPFSFNYLRAEKQLGYLAGSGYMPLCNTPGLVLYVQSHDHIGETLLTSIYNCLSRFVKELVMMEQDEYEHHLNAVIHQYEEQPSNLSQKCQQLWVSIGNKDYDFNQKEKIVNELRQLKLTQVQKWAEANLNVSSITAVDLTSNSETKLNSVK